MKNKSGQHTKLTTYATKGSYRAAKLWFSLLRHYQGANEQRLQLVLQRLLAGKRATSLSELESRLDQFDCDLNQYEEHARRDPQVMLNYFKPTPLKKYVQLSWRRLPRDWERRRMRT